MIFVFIYIFLQSYIIFSHKLDLRSAAIKRNGLKTCFPFIATLWKKMCHLIEIQRDTNLRSLNRGEKQAMSQPAAFLWSAEDHL